MLSARRPPPPIAGETRLEVICRRYRWFVVVAIVLAALWLRACDLRADPPPDLSWSFAPYTDEALNSYSARCLVLYGTWKVDDFFPFVVYPLTNLLTAGVMKVLGIGMVQLKLVSVIAGVLGIIAMYLLLRDSIGDLAAQIGSLTLATSFPLVMYSRLGLIETVQILFLLLAGVFWTRGLRRSWLMILCGFFAAGTIFLVKVSAIFIFPAMLVLFLWEWFSRQADPTQRRQLFGALLWFLCGCLAAAAFWFALVFLPYQNEYMRYLLRHSLESPQGHPNTPLTYFFNTLAIGVQAGLWQRLLVVCLIGFTTLPLFLHSGSRAIRYLLCWLIFGTLMLGYMNYRPPRYEIVLIPCIIGGYAAALSALLSTGTILPVSKPSALKWALYSVWLWPLGLHLLLKPSLFLAYRNPEHPPFFKPDGLLVGALAIAAALAGAVHLVWRIANRGISINSLRIRYAVAAIIVLLATTGDTKQFVKWFSERTHNIFSWSRELDRQLPDSAVVAGAWAPTLMVESRKRAVAVTDWANIANPMSRFGITHLILGQNQTDRDLADSVGEQVLANSLLRNRYLVRNRLVTQELILLELR